MRRPLPSRLLKAIRTPTLWSFFIYSLLAIVYWLEAQPDRGAVAQFPFIQDADQDQVYNTLIHQKPYIGGFFNATLPPQYLRIRPVLDLFPDAASISLLRELGVGYILVDSSQYPDYAVVHQQVQALGLQFLTQVSGQYVYIFY